MLSHNNKLLSLSVVAALAGTLLLPASSMASETVEKLNDLMSREHVSKEVVVEIEDGVDIADTSAGGFGLRHREIAENIYVLNVPFWLGTKFVLGELLDDPKVLVAEPNFIYQRTATPDDALLDQQWGLGAGFGANAFGAWDQGVTGSEEVVIAVIDDGVESNHPDLVNSMWVNPGEARDGVDNDGNGLVDDIHGWDFVRNTGDVRRDDSRFSHGTHVAGIIAAQSNNGIGVAGVAPGVKIMALGVFDDGGGVLDAIVAAFHYVSDMKQFYGVNIVATNNSYGGGYSENIKRAMDRAGNLGILHVAAAGNSSFDNDSVVSEFVQVGGETVEISRSFPASYQCYDDSRDHDCVISVASTQQNGEVSGFSNLGEFSVDLGAPGGAILSTVPLDYPGSTVQPGYAVFNGTSMAAPFVAGAIALCASANPSLSPGEIRSKLLATAKFNPDIFRWATTDGVLDISALVTSCLASVPTSMTGAPANLVVQQTLDPGHVKLSWDDNVIGEDGFVVRWGIKVGGVCAIPNGNIVAFLAPGTTSFVDVGYVTGETYCLQVEAFRGDTLSAAATSAELTIVDFDTVTFSGWVYKFESCDGIGGARVAFSAPGFPESVYYSKNDTAIFCGRYVEDAFFSLLIPRNVQGVLTISNPSSPSKTSLTTTPALPSDLEIQIPLRLSNDTLEADIQLPKYHQVIVDATDRLTLEGVANAPLAAALASGESFGCTSDLQIYQALWPREIDSANVVSGSLSCSYNPASANGGPVNTDRYGYATLQVLDSAMQNSTSQVRVTLSEPGGGPRFGQALVSTSQPSTLEISLLSVAGAPAAPVVTPGPAQLSVGLAAPSDNGGLEVSSYSVFTSGTVDGFFNAVVSGTCAGLVSPSLSTCTVTNLTAGIEKFVRFSANNEIGTGITSSASSGTPEEPPVVETPPAPEEPPVVETPPAPEEPPVVVNPPVLDETEVGTGGGGGGGGGAIPAPVISVPAGMENLGLRLEIPPGTTLEIPGGLKEVLLSGTGWELGFTPSGQISEAGVLTVPLGASNPIVISGYRPNSEVLVSVEKQSLSALALLFGSGFVRSQAITSVGTFTTNAQGTLATDIKLPTSLTTGDYKLIISGSSLLTGPVRVALPIAVTQAVDMGFAVWTKKFGLSQGKMYAKNPGGAGKVSFRLNGKEIAWVRAVDATDPKLRKVDVGPMAGVTYLVRTVNFVKGKNALEIFVDGKRVWRAAYTLR